MLGQFTSYAACSDSSDSSGSPTRSPPSALIQPVHAIRAYLMSRIAETWSYLMLRDPRRSRSATTALTSKCATAASARATCCPRPSLTPEATSSAQDGTHHRSVTGTAIRAVRRSSPTPLSASVHKCGPVASCVAWSTRALAIPIPSRLWRKRPRRHQWPLRQERGPLPTRCRDAQRALPSRGRLRPHFMRILCSQSRLTSRRNSPH